MFDFAEYDAIETDFTEIDRDLLDASAQTDLDEYEKLADQSHPCDDFYQRFIPFDRQDYECH